MLKQENYNKFKMENDNLNYERIIIKNNSLILWCFVLFLFYFILDKYVIKKNLIKEISKL